MTIEVPVIHEDTALLDDLSHYDESDNLRHPLNIPTSEMIESTSVLFYPNFFPTYFERENSIALSSQAFSHRSNNRISKHQSILRASGINGIITQYTDPSAMIGTITKTSILNLFVSKVGGIGMLILPGSFAKVGWLTGTLLLLVSGAASVGSLFLLEWICEAINTVDHENGNNDRINHHYSSTNPNPVHDGDAAYAVLSEATASYASVVAQTLGKPGSQFLETLTLVNCLGQLVAHLGATSSLVISLLSAVGIEAEGMFGIHEAILFLALGVIFPLSLFREEGSRIGISVLFGTICMVSIAFMVVFGDSLTVLQSGELCSLSPVFKQYDSGNEAKSFAWGCWITLLQNAPIFLFCMNVSVAYVPVHFHHRTCLRHLLNAVVVRSQILPTIVTMEYKESSKVIWMPMVIIGCMYLTCSMVAYLAYCDGVPENIVDAWPLTWIPGSIARLFLVVELLVAVADIYVPLGRDILWRLFYYGPNQSLWRKKMSRIIVTLGLVVVGAIWSVRLDGALVLPLVVTSALCVTAKMFVLPGVCAFALLGHRENRTSIPYKSLMAIGSAVIGALLGFVCLAAILGMLG